VNTLLIESTLASQVVLQLVQGDITSETTEAIVNAANEYLAHGAGVARAISQHGGPIIQSESDAWVRMYGPVSHAAPAWTSGGKLPCRYVIHAVGPIWEDAKRTGASEEADANLEAAITGSLCLAEELELSSIAFPAISTGIFGFPKERAANIMIKAVQRYFETKSHSGIQTVRLVILDQITITAFQKAWHDHFDA
jgi:O-acetyl-ADP-ribose deacetylase